MENQVTKQTAQMPALASEELQERMAAVKDNLESVDTLRLPITKVTSDGFVLSEDAEAVKEITCVIIHTKKTNVYYANAYNPNEKAVAPDCFSLDGNLPDASIEKPQHETCKGCAQAEFGSNSMKSGKACRNLKPIYLLLGDAIIPRELIVTPTSLKAANGYMMELAERGLAYKRVRTKITAYKENPRDTYAKLKFTFVEKLPEQESANVDFLKAQWLSAMDSQAVDSTPF